MELRTLRYLLVAVQEGSITNAAKRLHITQSTLSRQIADLEKELGRQLLVRGHSGVEPTEHGAILTAYADTIVSLAEKAEVDVKLPERSVSGCVHIAVGETKIIGLLGRAMVEVRRRYPDITFRMDSGNSADLMDGFVRGQYDFFLECEVRGHVDMNVLVLPERDTWGVLTRDDNPLAKLECIRPEDLIGHPILTSDQGMARDPLRSWAREVSDKLDIIATWNLSHNCRELVEAGLGSLVTYEGIFKIVPGCGFAFVPLDPPIHSKQGLIWRKTLPTRQAQVFLDVLRVIIDEEGA